jgi:hypothetical protein
MALVRRYWGKWGMPREKRKKRFDLSDTNFEITREHEIDMLSREMFHYGWQRKR